MSVTRKTAAVLRPAVVLAWLFIAAFWSLPREMRAGGGPGAPAMAAFLPAKQEPRSAAAFMVDGGNIARLAGKSWRAPWAVVPGSAPDDPGWIRCVSDAPDVQPLELELRLTGWHRIFASVAGGSAFRYVLSGREAIRGVPDESWRPGDDAPPELAKPEEYELPAEDLTGRVFRLMMGGSQRTWVRALRFVSMTKSEVEERLSKRRLASESGLSFAGYLEPISVRYYCAFALGLREHLRNEMRLNAERGSTDVYVHAIRIGTRAWYRSDVVERLAFRSAGEMRRLAEDVARRFGVPLPPAEKLEAAIAGNLKWTAWMDEGDPLAVAVEEGHAAGLKVFADAGMNVTHILDTPFMTEAAVRAHPEFLASHKMFMDFRRAAVRDYVVSVCRELLLKYDVDGLNMDFARWGYRDAYDVESLDDVVRRVHEARREAERKRGRSVLLAVRIPSYLYKNDPAWGEANYGGEHPWFLEALRNWARAGWIDRAMVCSMSKIRIPGLSLERYRDAVAKTKVELWGDLYGFHDRPPAALLDLGRKWVSEGLDGGFFIYDRGRPTAYEELQWDLRALALKRGRLCPSP